MRPIRLAGILLAALLLQAPLLAGCIDSFEPADIEVWILNERTSPVNVTVHIDGVPAFEGTLPGGDRSVGSITKAGTVHIKVPLVHVTASTADGTNGDRQLNLLRDPGPLDAAYQATHILVIVSDHGWRFQTSEGTPLLM